MKKELLQEVHILLQSAEGEGVIISLLENENDYVPSQFRRKIHESFYVERNLYLIDHSKSFRIQHSNCSRLYLKQRGTSIL